MTDSLAGARPKLNRARDHLEVLSDELAAFTAGEPYRVAHEPNADGSEHVFRAQVRKEPPAFLSVIIGDALQNMRSTLEHLAWGLTPLSTRQTSPRSISFPIYTKESAFFQTDRKTASGCATNSGMHKIWTMPPKVQAAIEQLQPYKTGHDHLFLLNELARVDRHQSLRLIGAFSDRYEESWRKRGERNFGVDLSVIRHATAILGPFEDSTKVGDYAFSEPEMEVNLKLTPFVAFRDEGSAKGRHVLRTLTDIRRHIESAVIPKLEGFF
jgi:hypothetical protein